MQYTLSAEEYEHLASIALDPEAYGAWKSRIELAQRAAALAIVRVVRDKAGNRLLHTESADAIKQCFAEMNCVVEEFPTLPRRLKLP